MNEPRGFAGALALMIPTAYETWSPKNPNKKTGKTIAVIDFYVKVLFPYLKTAANMTNLMLDYIPLGGAMVRAVEHKFFTNSDFKIDTFASIENRNTFVAKQLIGMSIVTSLLMKAIDDDDFEITAAGPKKYKDKPGIYEQGWQPFTMKIGDTRINYRDWPISGALIIIGAMADAHKYNDAQRLDEMMNNIVPTLGAYFTNASMLKTLSEISKAASTDQGSFPKIIASPITGFTNPAIVRHIQKMVDPHLKDKNTFKDSPMGDIGGHIIGNTMIAGHVLLDYKYNSLGDKINPSEGVNSIVRGVGLDRYFKSAKPTHPIFKVMAAKNVRFPSISDQVKINKVKLTHTELKKYALIVGKYRKKILSSQISQMEKMDSDRLQDHIKSIDKRAKAFAQKQIITTKKVSSLTEKDIDRIMARIQQKR